MKYPTPSNLAVAFCRQLAAILDAADIDEVIRRNEKEPNPSICHTHDYCDANQAMLDAWKSSTGEECYYAADDEPVNALIMVAWGLARDARFCCHDIEAEEDPHTEFTDAHQQLTADGGRESPDRV